MSPTISRGAFSNSSDTNNSNLKNNYSEVSIHSIDKDMMVPTGLKFCGLFMGDHSKCSINTMFNTGTVVGVYANIFGSGFPPKYVPSFSWGGAQGVTTFEIDKAILLAKEVFKRRQVDFDATEEKLLRSLFDMTKSAN